MKRVLTALSCLAACATETVAGSPAEAGALGAAGWPEAVLLRGTQLTFEGENFLVPELGDQRLIVDGGGKRLTLPLTFESTTQLRLTVGDDFLSVFPTGSRVSGAASIVRTLYETGASDEAAFQVSFEVVDNVNPAVDSIAGVDADGSVYPGDLLVLEGKGFLKRGEGQTIVGLQGAFESQTPPETLAVDVVVPATGTTRERLELILTPDIFGVRPGTFRGDITLVNEAFGGTAEGPRVPALEWRLRPPRIDALAPTLAGRGQPITAQGRGLLRTDPLYEATTLFRLEGSFLARLTGVETPLIGPTALALFPDEFIGNTAMRYILRVTQTPSGELEGLGLVAGAFTGRVTPMIISGGDTILGQGVDVVLEVALQKQVVFVKFLPGFSATVSEMGLGPREADIRARILEVCARDYVNVNIEFRDTRPTDYSEYGVIEVGGEDPNGQGLFGLDNTAGKDVGNIRFNDVIGGANAETAEQGYYAFGGVFVRSFFQMSPTLGADANLPIASLRFDQIFAPFMVGLGGAPPEQNPAPARRALADEAVRVLGNIVGNTVVHEVGHSLGLTAIEGEYHNIGDNDGWIMDSGNYRPFSERAEIDGNGSPVWAPFDRDYLERILPTD